VNSPRALATAYEEARPRLVRVAYAVLGSTAEAEDVVADCWLRLVDADAREPVVDVLAWGVVAVGRRALDSLRSARNRRETYVGPWLPEPLIGAGAPGDPVDRVTLDEEVGFALMVALEALTPAERTAWVLHDLFGLPFAEVATVVGRTPVAVRQLASRARAHVEARAPRTTLDPATHAKVLQSFLAAAAGGDLGALVAVLDPDVVLTSDGGGQVSAARRPVVGADRVARFLLGVVGRWQPGQRVVLARVNGSLGFIVANGTVAHLVGALTVEGGRVTRIDFVMPPEKLARVAVPGTS